MKNQLLSLLVIVTSFCATTANGQTESFSSSNIDSLLIAYNTHEQISLPKAYCLDQIVRYYTNEELYTEATAYNKKYGEISASLKSIDLINRYDYRQVRLDFQVSNEIKLDTAACSRTHTYFRANDSKMCSSISQMMVSFLRGPDGFGEPWLKDKEQLIKWYLLLGEDYYENSNYSYSVGRYYNASLNMSIDDYERVERTTRLAIKSYNKVNDNKYLQRDIYMRLAEVYFHTNDSLQLIKIEKEINALDNQYLVNDFKSAKMYYAPMMAAVGVQEKRSTLIRNLKDSTIINLPKGAYSYDVYDNKGKKLRTETLRMQGNTIIKESTDLRYKIHYEVQRSAAVQQSSKLLSVTRKTINEDQSSEEIDDTDAIWKFIIFHYKDGVISINDEIDVENSKKEQEEHMADFINDEVRHINLSEILEPPLEEYYNKMTYKKLTKLPTLQITDIPFVKKALINNYTPGDSIGAYWYEEFLLYENEYEDGYENPYQEIYVTLKNSLIKEGFQPFSSFPIYLASEKANLPYFNKENLYGQKLEQLENVENNGVSGVWIVEKAKNTKITFIDKELITIWSFGYTVSGPFESFRGFPRYGQDSIVLETSNERGETIKMEAEETYHMRLHIPGLEDQKVDGEYPEDVRNSLKYVAPKSKVNAKITENGYLHLEMDGETYLMISKDEFAEMKQMKPICGLKEYQEIVKKIYEGYEYKSGPSGLAIVNHTYIDGYKEDEFNLILELKARGYNPFLSIISSMKQLDN